MNCASKMVVLQGVSVLAYIHITYMYIAALNEAKVERFNKRQTDQQQQNEWFCASWMGGCYGYIRIALQYLSPFWFFWMHFEN